VISGLAGGSYAAEVWAQQINDALRETMVGLSVVNSRFSGQVTKPGDIVRMVQPGAVTSRAPTAYSAVTFEQPTAAGTTVTVDQADYTAVDVDDIDMVQSVPRLAAVHAQESAWSLADQQDTFVFKSYTAAGSGVQSDHANPIIASAVRMYTALVDAAWVMDTNNVPEWGRWCALSPVQAASLRANPQFAIGLPPRERGLGIPMNGYVGHAAGFAVYCTNNQTTMSGIGKVLLGHRSAIAFAGPKVFTGVQRRESRFASAIKSLAIYGQTVVKSDALATIHVRN